MPCEHERRAMRLALWMLAVWLVWWGLVFPVMATFL